MKHLLSLFISAIAAVSAIAGNEITLHDAIRGGFWPQTYAAIKPMEDGEHFVLSWLAVNRVGLVGFFWSGFLF